MAIFGVSPDKEQALAERMEKLGIREEDIVEKFIRSGGHGGQNVNKVATCVYLKHLPTGTEVKCQQERSQSLNRFLARRILADKIETAIVGKESAGGAADRQDPASEEEALQAGQGEDARRQAPRLREEEGPHLQARPRGRLTDDPGRRD